MKHCESLIETMFNNYSHEIAVLTLTVTIVMLGVTLSSILYILIAWFKLQDYQKRIKEEIEPRLEEIKERIGFLNNLISQFNYFPYVYSPLIRLLSDYIRAITGIQSEDCNKLKEEISISLRQYGELSERIVRLFFSKNTEEVIREIHYLKILLTTHPAIYKGILEQRLDYELRKEQRDEKIIKELRNAIKEVT